ncbi:MAG: hypothetical protein ICV80_22770 [Microcoleus sp. T1-bin1]|nr:hypothetical protein [Microcoleus sp. T1-bin1]
MTATIKIGSNIIQPKPDIRVLGVQIDTKLKWGPHVMKIQDKMVKQTAAMTKLTTSTWGATFKKARLLYTSVVRPALTYGSTVWHTPKEKKTGLINKLAVIQNKCLRNISGAFRATPVPVLEAETHIAPMNCHLDYLQAHARYRMLSAGVPKMISKRCMLIEAKLQKKTGRRRKHRETLGELKQKWAMQQWSTPEKPVESEPTPPWSDPVRTLLGLSTYHKHRKKEISRFHFDRWRKTWTEYQKTVSTPTPAQTGEIVKKRIKMHEQLMKAESSLATQIGTE